MSNGQLPTPASSDDAAFVDLRAVLNMIRRRFWVLLGVAALVFAIAVIVTFLATPRYTARAQVALEMRESQVVDFEAVLSGLPPDSAMVDTEVEVLRSRTLAGEVIDDLDLANSPEFNPRLRRPGPLDRLRESVDERLSALLPGQVVDLMDSDAEDDPSITERELVVNQLLAAMQFRRTGMTYVIDIAATSRAPHLARDIANSYAEQYLVSQLEAKYRATERANAWLNERVATLREEVRNREAAVARFREEAGLLDAEGASLTEQQISDVSAQLVLSRAELAEAEARLRSVQAQLNRGASADTISEVLDSSVIRDLRSQQAAIIQRRGELSSRYGPRHPSVITIEREQADLDLQIEREIDRIVTNLSNDVDVARERVRSLEQSEARLRQELAGNYGSLVRLRELERDADASRTLFQSILERFQQTSEQQSLTESDARVVSEAALPNRPSSPKVPLNLAIGLVLGGVCGAIAVVIAEILDNGLQVDRDVEVKLDQPHIASIPQVKPGLLSAVAGRPVSPVEYIVRKPLSGFAESFRAVRAAIRLNSLDRPVKVVAVTSALPGEGKTTVSICLGRIAALADSRVLVVDCDLRRRRLSAELVPDVPAGLLEVLNGDADLAATVVTDTRTGLDILPLSRLKFTPRDVFGSQAFADLLDRLGDSYDLVILDTAPVTAVADTLTIASRSDGIVFAARWRKTPVTLIRNALKTLLHARANVLGVVLNDVDFSAMARYEGGAFGAYYPSYREYYAE